jgi:cutinase
VLPAIHSRTAELAGYFGKSDCLYSLRVTNHRMSRWAGVGAAAVAAAGVLLVGLNAAPSAVPSAHADGCAAAEVIFARGTGEPKGVGKVGQAFVDSLRQDTGMDIDVYGVNYSAGKLQLGGGDGANDAINQIKTTVQKCPATKIVLGGYSQGASVIDIVGGVQVAGITWGHSLPPEYANNITAVATFGNIADRSGSPISAQSAVFGSKAIDMCNPGDPICHAGPGNEWSDHTDGYVPSFTTQAASFVAARLQAPGPNAIPGPLPGPAQGPATSPDVIAGANLPNGVVVR